MDKFPLKSKTILGALLAGAVTLLPFFGISFGADDAALVTEAFDKGLALFALVMTIWGRVDIGKKVA